MKAFVRLFLSDVLPARFIVAIVLTLSFAGCTSSILSKRTDEQAWIEYQSEKILERAPASDANEVRTIDPTVKEAISQIDLRKILLTCRGVAEKDCFSLTLKRTLDRALGEQVSYSERAQFLTSHSYEKTLVEVEGFHRLLLSGMDFRAGERMRALLKQCKGEPAEQLICMKASWAHDAQALLVETTERLGLVISNGETKSWIIERQIIPEYEKISYALTKQVGAKR